MQLWRGFLGFPWLWHFLTHSLFFVSWHWQFWGVLLKYFAECLSFGIFLTAVRIWGGRKNTEIKRNSSGGILSIYSKHHFHFEVDLDHLAQGGICQVSPWWSYSVLFPYITLYMKVTMYSPHGWRQNICLQYSELSCTEDLSNPFHLLSYSMIYLY